MEGWEDGEDLLVCVGGDLLDLETLCYYVLMGYHDLRYMMSALLVTSNAFKMGLKESLVKKVDKQLSVIQLSRY